MNDKNLILEEARRKAEEDLVKARRLVALYFWFGLGFLIVAGCLFSIIFQQGLKAWPFIGFILILFLFQFRSLRRQHYTLLEETLKFIEKEPQNADDYASRAGILYDYKFFEAAVEDYRAALAMEPNNNDVTWYDLAEVL